MSKISGFLFGILFFIFIIGYSQKNAANLAAPNLELPELFLSQYIQIESITGNEKDAGEFFANACSEAGLHVRVFTDKLDSYNFAASLYPLGSRKPNVVFLTHIDVVPEGIQEDWSHAPFSGSISDGYVWGRGAIDNKGHGVMQFFALKDFITLASVKDLPYNFTMLAVSSEEQMGQLGAKIIANEYLDELNPIVVFGEGGAGLRGVIEARPDQIVFGIETAQKKALWFNLESTGSSAGHGSVPMAKYPAKELLRACNAILDLKPEIIVTPVVREMFSVLSGYEMGLRRLAMRKINLFSTFIASILRSDEMSASLLTNTIVLTGISSDATAHNQIAQKLTASFDSRLLPGVDPDMFIKELEWVIKPYDVQLVIVNKPNHSPVSEKDSFYQAFEKAIIQVYPDAIVSPMLFPAVNDNRFFRKNGISTFGITPALLTQELLFSIHNTDERIPIDQLYKGIEIYNAFIELLISEP